MARSIKTQNLINLKKVKKANRERKKIWVYWDGKKLELRKQKTIEAYTALNMGKTVGLKLSGKPGYIRPVSAIVMHDDYIQVFHSDRIIVTNLRYDTNDYVWIIED